MNRPLGVASHSEIPSISLISKIFFFTARKRSLGQGNIFSSMCQEFCPRGGGLADQAPRGPGIPLEQSPQDQIPPDQPPPLCSACWEIRSTSGRYASYWNAILFGNINGGRKPHEIGERTVNTTKHIIHHTNKLSEIVFFFVSKNVKVNKPRNQTKYLPQWESLVSKYMSELGSSL